MSTAVLAISAFFYVNEPNVEMRLLPSPQSEVVSSAYYSEQVKVLEESGEWLKIKTQCDSYEGWIPKKVVYLSPIELYQNADVEIAKVIRISALLYDRKDTSYGPLLILPFESRLEVLDSSDNRWIKVCTLDGKEGFIQRGCVSLQSKVHTKQEMLEMADAFLGLPYTWGGRSSFGYDCSGFVQMLYRQMNIALPRDSKDQIISDKLNLISKDTLRPGDLIFWGLTEDKIRHVGLYLGNDEFIHATVRENKPWIRKSLLTDVEWNGQKEGDGGYAFRTFRTMKV